MALTELPKSLYFDMTREITKVTFSRTRQYFHEATMAPLLQFKKLPHYGEQRRVEAKREADRVFAPFAIGIYLVGGVWLISCI